MSLFSPLGLEWNSGSRVVPKSAKSTRAKWLQDFINPGMGRPMKTKGGATHTARLGDSGGESGLTGIPQISGATLQGPSTGNQTKAKRLKKIKNFKKGRHGAEIIPRINGTGGNIV